MNRALRKQHMRRFAMRAHGGGYGMGAPLVPFQASNDAAFSIKVPINQNFNDCAIPDRTGQIHNNAQPALAQAGWPLTGGRRTRRNKKLRGGCGCMVQRRRRSMRGGGNGFGINPAISVGGTGPNVGALVASVPCDVRAGSLNPYNPPAGNPDPKAPVDLYSLTANQAGGAAPGSSLPVYEAETAGFTFRPSTEVGGTLPDGITAYMDVKPYAARMGGARRRRNSRKQHKNARKSRRHRSMRRK
jgi:hypothetical protein